MMSLGESDGLRGSRRAFHDSCLACLLSPRMPYLQLLVVSPMFHFSPYNDNLKLPIFFGENYAPEVQTACWNEDFELLLNRHGA